MSLVSAGFPNIVSVEILKNAEGNVIKKGTTQDGKTIESPITHKPQKFTHGGKNFEVMDMLPSSWTKHCFNNVFVVFRSNISKWVWQDDHAFMDITRKLTVRWISPLSKHLLPKAWLFPLFTVGIPRFTVKMSSDVFTPVKELHRKFENLMSWFWIWPLLR